MKIRWEEQDMADGEYDPHDDEPPPRTHGEHVIGIVIVVFLIVTSLGLWAGLLTRWFG